MTTSRFPNQKDGLRGSDVHGNDKEAVLLPRSFVKGIKFVFVCSVLRQNVGLSFKQACEQIFDRDAKLIVGSNRICGVTG